MKQHMDRCTDRTPVLEWRNEAGRKRGKCRCGFEGWVQDNGRMYFHQRIAPGFTKPGLTHYEPSYESVDFLVLCEECGSVVGDQDAHDDWHNAVVEDLNQIRRKMEELIGATPSADQDPQEAGRGVPEGAPVAG